jgi:hypothetical protein
MNGAGALVALFVLPCVLSAQPRLEPGLRVRVSAPSVTPELIVGVLMAQTADTIDVVTADRIRRLVPAAAIQRLEVSEGGNRGARSFNGAMIGGAAGALAALIFRDKGAKPDLGNAAFTGASIGLVIGALTGGERWTPVFRRYEPVSSVGRSHGSRP